MTQKQVLVIVAIGLIASAALSYAVKSKIVCNIDKNEPSALSQGSQNKSTISLTEVTDNRDTKYAKVIVSYPRFENISSDFNKNTLDFVNSSLAEFNQNAEENWKARISTRMPGEEISEFPSEDEKFEFISEWDLSEMNNEYISVLITIYQFSGGAHGSTVMKSFNYDVKEKKDISLSSLFKDDQNYLNRISEYSINDLKEQLRGNEMSNLESIKEGAGPKIENFEIFTISRNKLTFYFPQYSIGPYALGIKTVDMYNWEQN